MLARDGAPPGPGHSAEGYLLSASDHQEPRDLPGASVSLFAIRPRSTEETWPATRTIGGRTRGSALGLGDRPRRPHPRGGPFLGGNPRYPLPIDAVRGVRARGGNSSDPGPPASAGVQLTRVSWSIRTLHYTTEWGLPSLSVLDLSRRSIFWV